MAEFRIGAYAYRHRRMDALTQFDVISKLSPIFAAGVGDLVPLMVKMKAEGALSAMGAAVAEGGAPDGAGAITAALAALQPVAKAFASMPDETRREVLHAVLDLVERKGDADQGWAKIWNSAGRAPMFDDIGSDASLMLRIAFEVLKATFLPFFKGIMPG